MARYVALIRFTEKGARAIARSATRAAAFRQGAIRAGLKIEAQLWTTGRYDGVLIVSGASDAGVLAAIARLNALGNVRTETLQAFDAGEFRRIAG